MDAAGDVWEFSKEQIRNTEINFEFGIEIGPDGKTTKKLGFSAKKYADGYDRYEQLLLREENVMLRERYLSVMEENIRLRGGGNALGSSRNYEKYELKDEN